MKKVAIIGAGASGLMAACFASPRSKVAVFEKQKMPGRKILATGNGRCNISNRNIDAAHYFGENPAFVHNVFGTFGLPETEAFFSEIGIPFAEGKDGKLYPASLTASSVQKNLVYEAQKRGAEIILHRKIEKIIPSKQSFTLITAGREQFTFDAVILAAGSCAYPQLGGSHEGYELARSLGHTITPLFPAIVPLNATPKALHRLEGIKWDCALAVCAVNTIIATSTGEVLFTKYGISGPAALDISHAVNREIIKGNSVEIHIDFFPDMSETELFALAELLCADTNKQCALSFSGIIKERIAEVIISSSGKDPFAPCSAIARDELRAIVNNFKHFRIFPGKPRPFTEAMVAAGGISTNEIHPATMESRIVPCFYITGELLDITGASGGYNLQFAWSTGAIAGMNV